MSRRPLAALDDLQLSLFDLPCAAPDVRADGPTMPGDGSANDHAAPSTPHATTHLASTAAPPELQAGELASPVANLLAPAVFRHPQADREIRLGGHLVGYALKRARRRSIGFIVGTEGLSVNAPKWVGLGDIDAALQEKSRWILRKLQEQQERARHLQSARVEWRDGTSIPFLGETVIVVLDPRAGLTAGGAVLHTQGSALPGVPKLTLHVGLSHTATQEQIRDVVQSWLQRQARRVFEERCAHFAPRLGVRVKRLALSSAQTRWGSASADGSIRLNWRLIHFAMPSIDYVVAHELAHLREMNHSARFWDVVRSVLPDYEAARSTLKDRLVPVLD